VFGLDDHVAELSAGAGLGVAIAVAALLGLRHATDPDHLTALSTLVLSEDRRGTRRAGRLGLAWGVGHACALLVVGLPVVVAHAILPDPVQRGAEAAVGLLIVFLALRLLLRWHRGYFHLHAHEHDGVRHVHPHVHEGARGGHAHHHEHAHDHAHDLGRTPRAAFGIGVLHGTGGSAGAGVLLLSAMPNRSVAALALVLFAVTTAASMAACSAGWGRLLDSGRVAPRLGAFAPAVGVGSLAFGVWYGVVALSGG
jgi:ABC-type nickel/cobalt efflux system permease component RcnA